MASGGAAFTAYPNALFRKYSEVEILQLSANALICSFSLGETRRSIRQVRSFLFRFINTFFLDFDAQKADEILLPSACQIVLKFQSLFL